MSDPAAVRLLLPRSSWPWLAELRDRLRDRAAEVIPAPGAACTLSPDPEATRRTATEVAALRVRIHAYERAETMARAAEAGRFLRGARRG